MVDQQRDHGQLIDLQDKTDKFEEKTNESVDDLETAVTTLEVVSNNDHQYLESDLEQLFNISSETSGKALVLEAEYNNLEARANASESAISSLQEQIISVEDSDIQFNGTLHEVEDKVSDLEEQATRHGDQLSTNKGAYDRLKFGFDQIFYQAVENKNKIASAMDDISDARNDISGLRTESQDTKQRLELANTQFEEMKEANAKEHKAFEESILNGQTKQESTQAELSTLKEDYQNYVDNSTRWKDNFSGFVLSDILNINKTLDKSADEATKRDKNIDLLENEIKMFKEEYSEDRSARADKFSALNDSVIDLSQKVRTGHEEHGKEINQTKDDIESNKESISKNEGKIFELTALAQKTTDEINSQHRAITSNDGQIEENKNAILSLKNDISDTRNDISCLQNPCENGGKCFYGGDAFRCECQPGWIGDKCETGIYAFISASIRWLLHTI